MTAPLTAQEGDATEAARARRTRRAIGGVLLGVLALVLVKALALESVLVVGNSMEPALQENDRVLVWKLAQPDRFDLIVFRHPLDERQNVIKRVVARGGERVSINAGQVVVDGRELGEPYLGHASDRDPTINMAELRVPEGYFFVLGDNRVASSDSRRFGAVDARLVVGRAVLALWPLRRL